MGADFGDDKAARKPSRSDSEKSARAVSWEATFVASAMWPSAERSTQRIAKFLEREDSGGGSSPISRKDSAKFPRISWSSASDCCASTSPGLKRHTCCHESMAQKADEPSCSASS